MTAREIVARASRYGRIVDGGCDIQIGDRVREMVD